MVRQPAERSEDERYPFAPPHRGGYRRREHYKPSRRQPPFRHGRLTGGSGLGCNVSGNPDATLGQPRQLSQTSRSRPSRETPGESCVRSIDRTGSAVAVGSTGHDN